MAGLVVRELLFKMGFKADPKAANVLDEKIGKLRKGFKKVGGAINRLRPGFNMLGKGILGVGAAVTGLGVGLGAMVVKTANATDQIGKMAKRLGVNVEHLQALKHAADLSGASFSDLTVGLRTLGRTSVEALKGNNEYSKSFRQLGVDVKDSSGRMKAPVQLLLEIADGMKGIKDPALRTKIAMDTLGRGGAALIPMLQGGSAAIMEMMEEARKLGLIVGKKGVQSAEDFMDSLTRMKGTIGGLVVGIGIKLMPVFKKWMDKIKEWILNNKDVIAQKIPELVEKLSKVLKKVGAVAFKMLKGAPGAVDKIAGALPAIIDSLGVILKLGRGIFWVFEMLGTLMGTVAAMIVTSVMSAYESVMQYFGELSKAWDGILLGIIGVFVSIGEKTTALWRSIKAGLSTAWDAIVEFFSGIFGFLGALPSGIWNAVTSGFSKALDWIKAKILGLKDWMKSKLGTLWKWLGGEEEKKIKISVEQARTAFAAAGNGPALAAVTPGAAPVGRAEAGRGALSYQPVINITVPPGTPATEAERVADATAAVSTRTFRRALGDIGR